MRDDAILDRIADAGSPAEAVALFRYHGTAVAFDDEPRSGGFDGVFWLADSPAVAQCYIPASSGKLLLSVASFVMNDLVRPSLSPSGEPTDLYAAALQFGFPAASGIERDRFGDVQSWICEKGYARNSDIVRKLAEWGYPWTPGRDFSAWVKLALHCAGEPVRIEPAGYAMPGRLFVVDGVRDLRLFDLAAGRDGDLTDPDHLKLDRFRLLKARGYDGVVISDFCQSETFGNFGHRSWGVFPGAISRLRYATIPATRFDWPDGDCSERVTPEFEQIWMERQAIAPAPAPF